MKLLSLNIQTAIQKKGLNPTSSVQIAQFVRSFELGLYISVIVLLVAWILHINSHYFLMLLVGLCDNAGHAIYGTAYNISLIVLIRNIFSRHTILLALTGVMFGILCICVVMGKHSLSLPIVVAMLIAPFVIVFLLKSKRVENFFTILFLEIYMVMALLLPFMASSEFTVRIVK